MVVPDLKINRVVLNGKGTSELTPLLSKNCFYYRIEKPNIKGKDQKTQAQQINVTNKKSITNEQTKNMYLLSIRHLSLNFQNVLLLTDLLIVYENHTQLSC